MSGDALEHAVGDVVRDGHRIEQGAALEHHGHLAADALQFERAHGSHLAAVNEDPARVGPQQADDLLEQHGLALAAAADEGHDFALAHGEVHAVMDDFAAEGQPHVAQFDGGGRGRRGRRGDDWLGVFSVILARCQRLRRGRW